MSVSFKKATLAIAMMFILLLSSSNVVFSSNVYGLSKPSAEWVTIKNDYFIDTSTGKRIYLHGINVMTELMPRYGNNPLTRTDIQAIKDLNINSVRLPIHWADFEPEFGRYDSGMLSKLDKYVSMFKEAGITVIIDIHTDSTHVDLPTHARPMYSIMFDDNARNSWLNFLGLLASRYKDDGNVIGFDILNEPTVDSSLWINSENTQLLALIKKKWQDWLQQRYQVIQAVNASFGSISITKPSGYNALLLETLNANETSFDKIGLPARFSDSSVPPYTSRILRYMEFQNELWASIVKEAARVIRVADNSPPGKFVVWEPWDNALDVPMELKGIPNLVVSYHNYRGGLDIEKEPIQTINDSSLFARLYGNTYPVIIGEFGARDDLLQTRTGLPAPFKDTGFWHFQMLQGTVNRGLVDGGFYWTYTNADSRDTSSLSYNPWRDYALRNKGVVYKSIADVANASMELNRSPEVAVVMLTHLTSFTSFLYLSHIDEALRRYNVDYDILWDFQITNATLSKYKAIIVQTNGAANTDAFKEIVAASQTSKVLLLGFNAGYGGLQYNKGQAYLAGGSLNMFWEMKNILKLPSVSERGIDISEDLSEKLLVKKSWYDFKQDEIYPARLSRVYFDISPNIFQEGNSIILERAECLYFCSGFGVGLAQKDNWLIYYHNGPLFTGDLATTRIIDTSDAFWKVISSFLKWSGVSMSQGSDSLDIIVDQVGGYTLMSNRLGNEYNLTNNGVSALALASSLIVNPNETIPSYTVNVTGTSYAPNSEITITFDDIELKKVISDGNGTFATSITIPSDTSFDPDSWGRYPKYTVRVVDSSIHHNSAYKFIKVVAPPGISLSPLAVEKGRNLTVWGKTFSSGSEVVLLLAGQKIGSVIANELGYFVVNVTMPDTVPSGNYTLTGKDENNRTASHWVVVFGSNGSSEENLSATSFELDYGITFAKAKQTTLLQTTITNNQKQEQKFINILQIRDMKGYVAYLTWKNILIQGEGSLSVTFPWIPEIEGTYTAEIFFWTEMSNPIPLTQEPYITMLIVN